MLQGINRWVALGALCVPLLAAGDVQAGWFGTNALAVSACKPSPTSAAVEMRWDGVYNASLTQTMYLDCSLPFSHDSDDRDPNLFQTQLYYTDNSATEQIDCYAQVRDWDGTLLETAARQKSGLAYVGAQQYFHWGNFTEDGLPYLSCVIPKKVGNALSGLHGMSVVF